MMNELSLVFVRREAAQVAPGPFVAGLAGPSYSRRGVLAGGPPDAPGVDGVLGTGGRGVWWCCRICALRTWPERIWCTMKIYMDVCCLNRPLDDQTQDRIRIESEAVLAILNRCRFDWTLVRSEVINYEISKIPDYERWKLVEIIASISKVCVAIDEDVITRGHEIEKIGLRAMDALHIACAEKSAEVMLTTDDEIVRKAKKNVEIAVENPVRWLMDVL